MLNLTADDAGCALVAFLCGAWWAAPVPREQTAAGFGSAKCSACGAESGCLPLPLVWGPVGVELACPCPTAARVRMAWETKVAER